MPTNPGSSCAANFPLVWGDGLAETLVGPTRASGLRWRLVMALVPDYGLAETPVLASSAAPARETRSLSFKTRR